MRIRLARFVFQPKDELMAFLFSFVFPFILAAVLQTGGLQVRGIRGLRLARLRLHLHHPDRHRAQVGGGLTPHRHIICANSVYFEQKKKIPAEEMIAANEK